MPLQDVIHERTSEYGDKCTYDFLAPESGGNIDIRIVVVVEVSC